MRKLFSLLLCCGLVVAFSVGCSSADQVQEGTQNLELLEDVKNTKPERALQTEKEVFFDTTSEVESTPLDLTGLDTLVAYGAVYEMIINPQQYFGRTVAIKGTYYAEYYESTGEYYHYVVVSDEQACCKQGVEFILPGEHWYPDDYPENETTIQIEGTFGYYQEGQSRIACLLADSLSPIDA